jgi:hypothetical protein
MKTESPVTTEEREEIPDVVLLVSGIAFMIFVLLAVSAAE